jgi:hypothetical protein
MKTFKFVIVFFVFYYGITTLIWIPSGLTWTTVVSHPASWIFVGVICLILAVKWAEETEEA